MSNNKMLLDAAFFIKNGMHGKQNKKTCHTKLNFYTVKQMVWVTKNICKKYEKQKKSSKPIVKQHNKRLRKGV